MDLQKICRLCFKSDIQNEFIDMQAVPGLCDEIALVYGLEICMEDDGISKLICSDCRNKTITLSVHVELVQKTQLKIAELRGQAAPNSVAQSIRDTQLNNENRKIEMQPSTNELRNTSNSKNVQNNDANSGSMNGGQLGIGKHKVNDNNPSKKHGKGEKFADGERVNYYDIQLQQSIEAVIVKRITYGQYRIKVGSRTFVRKAFFLTKK